MTYPTVAPDSTLVAIQNKARRLAGSPLTSNLTVNELNDRINTFYQNDFPYAIKIDQMRDVYTFYTEPNVDRYFLDVNFFQGVRDPVYVEGIQGGFYKDRQEFFRRWPRWPARFTPATGDGSTQDFKFTIQGPFLRNEVVVGVKASDGASVSLASTIRIIDGGDGNLYYVAINPQTTVPSITDSTPGMHNENLSNPGQANLTQIGTVDYVTGEFDFNLAIVGTSSEFIPRNGEQFIAWVSQYQPSRPFSVMFWNNYFTVRPVPDNVYKIEVEAYQTPVRFLQQSSNPIVNQWWQYIAYGVAAEIARDRQDMESLENILEGMRRQEALVLQRQSVEEIGQRNNTIFSGESSFGPWGAGWSQGWW